MRIEEVHISNFCSCHAVSVQLSEFTPLIGYNNSGKSNILRAIAWLLKKSALPKHLFWDPAAPIVVEGLITNVNIASLPANQQAQIAPYIHNGSLRFRRRQDSPSSTAAQIRIEVLNPATGQWAANPTGLDTAIGVLFPEPIYIEAMEDAADDVSRFAAKNTIGLLLKYTISQLRDQNAQAMGVLETALQQVGNLLTGAQRLQELNHFEARASQAIAPFFPGLELKLKIASPDLDELVKSASIELSDGGAIRPFTSYGHGAQRSVHMALVKLLASYAHAQNGETVVLLIDEPELYLHPQAVEILRESLRTLSAQGFQVIFSTHSPLLIAGDDVLNTTIVFKDAATGTAARARLATAAQVLAGNPHQTAVTFSLQHSTYLLFSESVLIVEGKTERMVIPPAYKVVRGNTMGFNRACLVEASGSSSLLPMSQVLQAVGFAPKIVADLDFLFRDLRGGIVSANAPEVLACMAWLTQNTGLGFALDAKGLPTKRDAQGNFATVAPEAAYAMLASALPGEVSALVTAVRASGIWIWSKGSIEHHLGIQKNDAARIGFISQAQSTNSLAHAADAAELTSFLSWI